MTDRCYLVFVRSQDRGWHFDGEFTVERLARERAVDLIDVGADRVCVMEVGGKDALPMFTLKTTVQPSPSVEPA